MWRGGQLSCLRPRESCGIGTTIACHSASSPELERLRAYQASAESLQSENKGGHHWLCEIESLLP